MYQGGALRLGLTAGAGVAINPPPPGITAPKDLSQLHYHLPLLTLDTAIGWPMPWLKGVVAHNRPDGFWRRLEATPELEKLDVAAQNIVGYFDLFCGETVENFLRLPRNGKKQLILGPWDHTTVGKHVIAGIDFGPEAELDVAGENLRWFNRFLKPHGGAGPFAPVRYFVMGDNVWRTADDWPPPEAVTTEFYLHSAGKANSRAGDGQLTHQPPTTDELSDHAASDPDHPVPSEQDDAPQPSRSTPWRPVNRSRIEDRADVLIYNAPVQAKPLIIAGRVAADLWVSVDAPDADWVVKLIDVAPDGTARGIAEGILRSSGRDPSTYPALLDPGRRYRLLIDLGHTAATILPHHALRLEIAGSAFPMFDRNLHTGEGPGGTRKRVCTQTVYHTRGAVSRLLLPLLPASPTAQPRSSEHGHH
jgi:putative CocE/NonD family hydrolase